MQEYLSEWMSCATVSARALRQRPAGDSGTFEIEDMKPIRAHVRDLRPPPAENLERILNRMASRRQRLVHDQVQVLGSTTATTAGGRQPTAAAPDATMNADFDQAMSAMLQQGGGVETLRRDAPKVGRNDPCPCGSGKKYKRCCGSTV